MKYLITGATGQLGSEWVRYFRNQGINFSAFDSSQFDITDIGSVNNIISRENPDVVVNCAAYTKVDQAEKEQEKAFLVNETGVKNLINICERTGAFLVHFSTDYVFPGKVADREKYPAGYPEDAATDPVNAYGRSKRAGELALINSRLNWILIRVSWLCGVAGSNFVKTMLRLASKKNQIDVVNDQTGSPSFTFDVVEKTLYLLNNNQRGIFHISSKDEVSWADFAEEIFEQSGLSVRVRGISSSDYPVLAKRPFFSLLSNRKIEEAGLQPLTLTAGLSKLLHQIKKL